MPYAGVGTVDGDDPELLRVESSLVEAALLVFISAVDLLHVRHERAPLHATCEVAV